MAKQTTMKKKSKPYAENTMLKLWIKTVRHVYGHKCFLCGKEGDENLQCHHFIERKHLITRWKWQNGIALCPECHKLAHTKKGIWYLLNKYKYYFQMADLENILFEDYCKKEKTNKEKYYKQLHSEMNEILKGVKNGKEKSKTNNI